MSDFLWLRLSVEKAYLMTCCKSRSKASQLSLLRMGMYVSKSDCDAEKSRNMLYNNPGRKTSLCLSDEE